MPKHSHTTTQKWQWVNATSGKAPWSAGLGREALPQLLLFCGRHRQVEDKRLDYDAISGT